MVAPNFQRKQCEHFESIWFRTKSLIYHFKNFLQYNFTLKNLDKLRWGRGGRTRFNKEIFIVLIKFQAIQVQY